MAVRLLDLIFPPRCAGCGESGSVLCAKCRASFRAPEPPLCPRCGHDRVSSPTACPVCAHGRGPAVLTGMRAAVIYEGSARQAILALKFRGQRRVAEPLGDLLADLCSQEHIPADIVVPVPLHPARKRRRGYNQAELLARQCGLRLACPMRSDLLTRRRDTPPQTSLPSPERRRNVKDAFVLAASASATLAGKHVLLVDDVSTTGSTLDAAAAAIAQAQPASIWGVVVARPNEREQMSHHNGAS